MHRIESFVLTAKHWQIFGSFFFFGLLITQTTNNLFYNFLNGIFLSATYTWILLLGLALQKKAQSAPDRHYTFFKFSGALLISMGFFEVLLAEYVAPFLLSTWWLFSIYGVCFLTINFVFCSYPAKVLNSLRTTDIDINDYFGDSLGLIFWPIGIWFIQPKINKIEPARSA